MHIREEMNLHLAYCKEFGLSKEEVESHEESQGERLMKVEENFAKFLIACTAYTRFVDLM